MRPRHRDRLNGHGGPPSAPQMPCNAFGDRPDLSYKPETLSLPASRGEGPQSPPLPHYQEAGVGSAAWTATQDSHKTCEYQTASSLLHRHPVHFQQSEVETHVS